MPGFTGIVIRFQTEARDLSPLLLSNGKVGVFTRVRQRPSRAEINKLVELQFLPSYAFVAGTRITLLVPVTCFQ